MQGVGDIQLQLAPRFILVQRLNVPPAHVPVPPARTVLGRLPREQPRGVYIGIVSVLGDVVVVRTFRTQVRVVDELLALDIRSAMCPGALCANSQRGRRR